MMAIWGKTDTERVEQRLRDLMVSGCSVEEAVQAIHRDDGVGALFICPAVEAVAGLSPLEAKRLVVRALFPLWNR